MNRYPIGTSRDSLA